MLCFLLLPPALVMSAPPAPGGSAVDEDFPFQGEYAGSFEAGMAGPVRVGLQLAAVGGGAFEGRLLMQGLPGAGWNGFASIPVRGTRNGSQVVVTGGPYSLTLDLGGFARLKYATGRTVVGLLRQVHRTSPTLGAAAPCGAVSLFNGCDTFYWKNGRISAEGYLEAGAETLCPYQDFCLHLEFRIPYAPAARSQGRGNSGVYLQGRYEVQILDSFALAGTDADCGALYRTKTPDINMSLPPGAWQTYDIDFTAARFGTDGRKVRNATITVRHNGVVVHDNVEIPTKTGAGLPEGPEPMPIKLQDHGAPVQFRNVWLVDRCALPVCLPCCCISNCCRMCCGVLPCCDSCRSLCASCPSSQPGLPLPSATPLCDVCDRPVYGPQLAIRTAAPTGRLDLVREPLPSQRVSLLDDSTSR